MKCNHPNFRLLGPYTTFRKYICDKCGKVFICKCEKELAQTFLPHQTNSATELGTYVGYPVEGFLPNICEACNGKKETPYPRRYGSLIDRYYWREIEKTYYMLALDWLKLNQLLIKDLSEFESKYSKISNSLKKEAKTKWKKEHKYNPKYETTEKIDLDKIELIDNQTIKVTIQRRKMKTATNSTLKWCIDETDYDEIEAAVAHHYRNQGYTVWFNETKLISTLIGVYGTLAPHYDPRINLKYKHLTENWEERKNLDQQSLLTKNINMSSRDYYLRHETEIANLVIKLNETDDLYTLFETLYLREKKRFYELGYGVPLWERLHRDNDYGFKLARDFLTKVSKETVLSLIEYSIHNFYWSRTGWPDLVCLKDDDYLFVEVKSPSDTLRPEQIDWFIWAFETGIRCEVCQVVNKFGNISSYFQ